MHRLAVTNRLESAEVLVAAGAGVDEVDIAGRTPLMLAAVNGSTSVLEWLLRHGADWRLQDTSGATALGLVEVHGHAETANALSTWASAH